MSSTKARMVLLGAAAAALGGCDLGPPRCEIEFPPELVDTLNRTPSLGNPMEFAIAASFNVDGECPSEALLRLASLAVKREDFVEAYKELSKDNKGFPVLSGITNVFFALKRHGPKEFPKDGVVMADKQRMFSKHRSARALYALTAKYAKNKDAKDIAESWVNAYAGKMDWGTRVTLFEDGHLAALPDPPDWKGWHYEAIAPPKKKWAPKIPLPNIGRRPRRPAPSRKSSK